MRQRPREIIFIIFLALVSWCLSFTVLNPAALLAQTDQNSLISPTALDGQNQGDQTSARQSALPPLRPPEDSSQPAPGTQTSQPPQGAVSQPGFNSQAQSQGQERYYLSEDRENWPEAVSNFARNLMVEVFVNTSHSGGGLDWYLQETLDEAEEQAARFLENKPEASQPDFQAAVLSFLTRLIHQKVSALAIDKSGQYHIMYTDDNPEGGEWLPTSVSEASDTLSPWTQNTGPGGNYRDGAGRPGNRPTDAPNPSAQGHYSYLPDSPPPREYRER